MNKKRIFAAINLPKKIKEELVDFEYKYNEIPARWAKPKNIHITLAFLGYLADNEIYEVCKAVKETAEKTEPFDIKLERICYGPIKGTGEGQGRDRGGTVPESPRMIWAIGEKSAEFSDLKNNLEKALSQYAVEKKEFTPHITLARIKQWQYKQIEPEERQEVGEDINLSFRANSIEIMESKLKIGGADYSIFESYSFGK